MHDIYGLPSTREGLIKMKEQIFNSLDELQDAHDIYINYKRQLKLIEKRLRKIQ